MELFWEREVSLGAFLEGFVDSIGRDPQLQEAMRTSYVEKSLRYRKIYLSVLDAIKQEPDYTTLMMLVEEVHQLAATPPET